MQHKAMTFITFQDKSLYPKYENVYVVVSHKIDQIILYCTLITLSFFT